MNPLSIVAFSAVVVLLALAGTQASPLGSLPPTGGLPLDKIPGKNLIKRELPAPVQQATSSLPNTNQITESATEVIDGSTNAPVDSVNIENVTDSVGLPDTNGLTNIANGSTGTN
jgi:hypothetical protein